MKYKDLIDKLLPLADEEINMSIFSDEKTGEVTDEVRFYHSKDCEEYFVVGVKQTYSKSSCENIGEAKIILNNYEKE